MEWEVLDIYFQSHMYPFTKHHIDSFHNMFKTHIPNIIKSYNPITMLKQNDAGTRELIRVEVYVGGQNGNGIYVDRPTITDNEGRSILLTPNEARLRNLTYATKLYADITAKYFKDSEPEPFAVHEFPYTIIGQIPIMLHSDQCVLHKQGSKVLYALRECPLDPGGYFIVEGKEKVIVSQERIITNKLFVSQIDDDDFSHRGYIHCTGATGETALSPRSVEFVIVKHKELEPKNTEDDTKQHESKKEYAKVPGAILVSLPSIRGRLPLTTVFRAFGIVSDKDIIEAICGPIEHVPLSILNFLRPSIAHNGPLNAKGEMQPIYTMTDALDAMKNRVFFSDSVDHLKVILSTDVFPNIEGGMAEKGKYLAYLVSTFIKTVLGVLPFSDRDGFIYKRIDVSGMLLSQLFQETYTKFRNAVRDRLDQQYYFKWLGYDVEEMQNMIHQKNLHFMFPSNLITDTFLKSLKGAWGAPGPDSDPELGIVQDLSRISYIGFLSHLRRVNNGLDRSLKIRSPHVLHSQQWGIMCPFESPDGASIGYLKNFALLTQVSFGTNPKAVIEAIRLTGVTQSISSIPCIHLARNDVVKLLINGSLYGITTDPVFLTKAIRAFRRNGLLDPFISIAWNIKENEIRINTDAGRPCRPLFIVEDGVALVENHQDNLHKMTWNDLILGSLKDVKRDSDVFTSPYELHNFENKDLDQIIDALDKTKGCIEYLDIEEENTTLIAMSHADLAKSPYYTHMEIHPSTALSVVTNIVPFANHNQAPRVYFHAAQSKQAISVYATNWNHRFDTAGYIHHYPQRRIVGTRGSHYNGNNRMPNGFNVIVAIMTHSGFNQEDSIMINRRAIDRGLFHVTSYKSVTAQEEVLSDFERTKFVNPVKVQASGADISGVKHANYELINDRGIIAEDSYIPRGQQAVVIGMVNETITQKKVQRGVFVENENVSVMKDISITTDVNHYGRIDRVYVYPPFDNANNNNNHNKDDNAPPSPPRICKVRFRKVRRPELGDKHCLTPDHEVLTTNGWKSIADVTVEDTVYVLKKNGSFGLEKPTKLYEYDCEDEDMVTVESSHVDLVMTKNHKAWVSVIENESHRKDALDKFKFIQASGLQDKTVLYSKTANNPYPEYTHKKDDHFDFDISKSFPEWVWHLNGDQSMRLYKCLRRQISDWTLLKDELQRLALHAGMSADDTAVNESEDQNYPVVNPEQVSITKYTGKVYCIEVPSHVFYVRRSGKPVWTGNSSAHGQKGVIGMILNPENMPFTKDGIIPDIIINPHAIPTRMTMGHLLETVFAKLCCMDGCVGDGSVFIPFDKEHVFDGLEKHNFERHGNEVLYDGRTGTQLDTEIFIGPIFYYRLKHMVEDKMQSRGNFDLSRVKSLQEGKRALLTHQPPNGRALGGGLRLGEMERDVLIGHGISQFLKESMMERSDKFKWAVCRHCGTIANYNPKQRIASCNGCGQNDIQVITTPWSFKLLIQELEGMGVQMRLSVDPIPEGDAALTYVDTEDQLDLDQLDNLADDLDDGYDMSDDQEGGQDPEETETEEEKHTDEEQQDVSDDNNDIDASEGDTVPDPSEGDTEPDPISDDKEGQTSSDAEDVPPPEGITNAIPEDVPQSVESITDPPEPPSPSHVENIPDVTPEQPSSSLKGETVEEVLSSNDLSNIEQPNNAENPVNKKEVSTDIVYPAPQQGGKEITVSLDTPVAPLNGGSTIKEIFIRGGAGVGGKKMKEPKYEAEEDNDDFFAAL